MNGAGIGDPQSAQKQAFVVAPESRGQVKSVAIRPATLAPAPPPPLYRPFPAVDAADRTTRS